MVIEQAGHRHFNVSSKTVDVYLGIAPNCPIIYLNTVSEEGGQVRQLLEKMGCPDHSLVAVSGLEWNHDMTPWSIPPIFPDDPPCTGGADAYLRLLQEEIIPQAEEMLQRTPSWRGLAGYSLAGLFAVYSMYRTDLFSRIASISGSLWFPGFKEYAISHKPAKSPEHLYFSLGSRECKTRNPYLRTVQSSTEELAVFYQNQQIDTEFQLNPGNHFTEPVKRSALGIQWLVTR